MKVKLGGEETAIRMPISWRLPALRAVVLAVAVAVAFVVSARSPAAGAYVPTVGAPCAFRLGAPLVTGALGTAGLEFPLYPADPHQVCQAGVSMTASLTPAGGGRFSNVGDDPETVSATVAFTGSAVPPGLRWTWTPHCADPAVPAVFSLTVAGQTSTSPAQPPDSCFPDLGGRSRIGFDFVDPHDGQVSVGIAPTADGHGYWVLGAAGPNTTALGSAPTGPAVDIADQSVGIATDPSGAGYWVAGIDGGVFAFDGAPFYGSMGGVRLSAPVVGMAATPDGRGYWLVGADGGVFSFGDAAFYGSLGGIRLSAPIVGMTAGPAGGYRLVGYDGGVFDFGGALFEGSAAGLELNAPVTAMAATPSGRGYWLLGADGGVFTYGDAGFYGAASAP